MGNFQGDKRPLRIIRREVNSCISTHVPMGFLKVTNVYFVLSILMEKGYCTVFDVFISYRLCVYIQTIVHFIAPAEISSCMS